MARCAICNSKLPLLGSFKAKDGSICGMCTKLSSSFRTDTIEVLKKYYQINEYRKKIFRETQKLKSIFSCIVSIDDKNRLFYFVPKKNDIYYIVYSFDEIVSYEIEYPNAVTKTKTKGGISRALVGAAIAGPVGAVVGASTAQQISTTSNGTGSFYLNLNTFSGLAKVFVYSPPSGFSNFLDKCIKENKEKGTNSKSHVNDVEDIIKYKELLDKGIITEEEFIIKKKQILNI